MNLGFGGSLHIRIEVLGFHQFLNFCYQFEHGYRRLVSKIERLTLNLILLQSLCQMEISADCVFHVEVVSYERAVAPDDG